MITKVVKSTWTQKDGREGFCYKVYYKSKDAWRSDRRVTYTDRQNLPLTVLNFVLNAENVDTVYLPEKDRSPCFMSVKRETYRA